MAVQHDIRPPWVASRIMTLCAFPACREEMIGDLFEEWIVRRESSITAANAWYWDQVIRSMPGLLMHRLWQIGAVRLGVLILAYVFSLLVITRWDISVSFVVIEALRSHSNPLALFYINAIYFLLFTLGAAIAAIPTAILVFKKDDSFRNNLWRSYGPIFIAMSGFMLHGIYTAMTWEVMLVFVIRCLILIATFIASACLVSRFKSFSPRGLSS